MAYSRPVDGSVQPHPPLPRPPPMPDSGRLASRSMFLQAKPPAVPLVHGVAARGAAVAAVGSRASVTAPVSATVAIFPNMGDLPFVAALLARDARCGEVRHSGTA